MRASSTTRANRRAPQARRNRTGLVPAYVLVEAVSYQDAAPWPGGADGFGLSLQRRDPPPTATIRPTGSRSANSRHGHPGWRGGPDHHGRAAEPDALAYQDVVLSVSATGTAPLRYQWRLNGANLAGATNAILELKAVQPEQAGDYQVLVYNDAGSALSVPAALALLYPAAILAEPQSVSTRPGSNIVFSVIAYSPAGLRYQWQKNGVNLEGATGESLSLANVQPADAATYTVVVTDAIGSVASAPATLTILVDPIITQQPLSQMVVPGATVVLSVSVTNAATLPIGFRVRRNNATLPATPATFMTINERTVYFTLSGTNTMPPWTNYAFVVTNVVRPTGNLTASAFLTYVTDSDADGMPDAWETAYGSEPNNPADAMLDRDGDGLSNWQEYVAGTDPTDASSYLKVTVLAADGSASVAFGAVSNRTYTVQFTDGLGEGAWSKLADVGARATNRVEQIQDASHGTNRFYRVVTPRQP